MPNDPLIDRLFVYTDQELNFAVPILDVIDVVFLTDLRLGHVRWPGYLGNFRHRDRLLPLIDSASLSRGVIAGAEPDVPSSAVVLRRGDFSFGLSLGKFLAVIPVSAEWRESMRPAPASPLATFPGSIVSVFAYRDSALVVLSGEALARGIESCFGDQRIVGLDSPVSDAATGQPAREEEPVEGCLCVSLESLRLAIPVDRVIEVIENCEVTPFFGVDGMLRGLINLRGEVIACVDISPVLGLPNRELLEKGQYVVLQSGKGKLALCVDRVDRIRLLPVSRAQEPTVVVASEMTPFLDGVLDYERESIFVVSVPRIFGSPQLAPYRKADA